MSKEQLKERSKGFAVLAFMVDRKSPETPKTIPLTVWGDWDNVVLDTVSKTRDRI
jgi:hypothetical protein